MESTFSIYYNYYWARSFAIDMFLLSMTLLLMSDFNEEALSLLMIDYLLNSAVFYYSNSIDCLNSGAGLLYSF